MALEGFDNNDESSHVVGDLSMGFYEASSVPLGMDLYDCDEDEDCFHAFENPAATADYENEQSEVRSCSFSVNRPSVITTRKASTSTVGRKSTSAILAENKIRQKLQKFRVWLLTGTGPCE
jgi:hypothetical protein